MKSSNFTKLNNYIKLTCLITFTQGSNAALNACVIAPPAGNSTPLLRNTVWQVYVNPNSRYISVTLTHTRLYF